MKHFMIDITYIKPIEYIQEILQSHREFLQKGYDSGNLLMSGPKNPLVGGIIIAKAESLEKIIDIFKNDPYQINEAAEYKFIEFSPVKRQGFLEPWID